MNSPMLLLLLTTTAALLHSTAAIPSNFVWSGTMPVGQVATKAEFEEGFRIFLLRLEIVASREGGN